MRSTSQDLALNCKRLVHYSRRVLVFLAFYDIEIIVGFKMSVMLRMAKWIEFGEEAAGIVFDRLFFFEAGRFCYYPHCDCNEFWV